MHSYQNVTDFRGFLISRVFFIGSFKGFQGWGEVSDYFQGLKILALDAAHAKYTHRGTRTKEKLSI